MIGTIALMVAAVCGGRTSLGLNDGWWSELHPEKGVVRRLENVKIPHNWEDYHDMRTLVHGSLHGSATYRRSFVATGLAGRRSFLVFDGAGMYLTARLNGRELCRHRPAGRLVTTLETTGVAHEGENVLEVVCEHPSEIMDLPWHCGGCSGIGSEGPEALGLFREVRFETTAPVRIKPFGVHVWPDKTLTKVFVETEISAMTGGVVIVQTAAPELGIDRSTFVDVTAGEVRVVRQEFPLGSFERWSPAHPRLYGFTVRVTCADAVDSTEVQTGFRTIEWPRGAKGDGRFRVNGEPVFIHGVCETDNRFGSNLAFDRAETMARCDEFEKLGFNAWRDGHEPHALCLGERWDRDGVLWWPQFSTHTYFDTDEFKDNFRRMLRQWVRERRNSPSVVLWGLQNESVIAPDFAEEMTALIHELDPLSGEGGRLVTTCNYGCGTDWNVIQNWSGCYSGEIEDYGTELSDKVQLLNGEYGAWRSLGFHADPDSAFVKKDPWTEEHAAYVLWQKMLRAWDVRDRVCGHFQWTFFTHERAGGNKLDEGFSLLDKFGPLNPKGLLTLDGRRVASWYAYRSYGHHLKNGTIGEHRDKPLSWWLAEGRRLEDEAQAGKPVPPAVDLAPKSGETYLARLNCGGDRAVDSCGNAWAADSTAWSESWANAADLKDERVKLDPMLGSRFVVEGDLPERALFGTYRYGRNRLKFTFDAPAGKDCTVEAYFVEPGSYGRIFDVALNGRTVEDDFDLGAFRAKTVVKREWTVKASADGKIVLSFPEVKVNQAVVSAIAVRIAAANVAGWTPPARTAGYPESAGLTWAALAAQTKEQMRIDKMEAGRIVPTTPLQPTPNPEDGWRRARFLLRMAGKYSVGILVRQGEVAGKTLQWRLTSIDDYDKKTDKWICKKDFGRGEFTMPATKVGKKFDLPFDFEINAGSYMVWYKVDGAELEAREMK